MLFTLGRHELFLDSETLPPLMEEFMQQPVPKALKELKLLIWWINVWHLQVKKPLPYQQQQGHVESSSTAF